MVGLFAKDCVIVSDLKLIILKKILFTLKFDETKSEKYCYFINTASGVRSQSLCLYFTFKKNIPTLPFKKVNPLSANPTKWSNTLKNTHTRGWRLKGFSRKGFFYYSAESKFWFENSWKVFWSILLVCKILTL